MNLRGDRCTSSDSHPESKIPLSLMSTTVMRTNIPFEMSLVYPAVMTPRNLKGRNRVPMMSPEVGGR
jgi:hypothetical protein